MKHTFLYKIVIIFVFIFFAQNAHAEYRQQWFTNFLQKWNTVEATCKTQCIVLVWELSNFDVLKIDWEITWSGKIGYGFLFQNKLIPVDIIDITQKNIHLNFNFSKSSFFYQIPKNTQVVVLFEGNQKIKNTIRLYKNTFQENIHQYFSDFLYFDTFKPYTINLLYWPKIAGRSVNNTFYILIIFGSIFLFTYFKIRHKKKVWKFIMWYILVLWCIYDIRMGMEINSYYVNDFNTYISKERWEQTYRDRGYFYSFLDFTNEKLKENNIKKYEEISFYSDNNWPFSWTSKYFLYPYNVQYNKETSKIFIIYWYKRARIEKDTLFINNKNIWKGKVYPFEKGGFIFIK